MKEINQILKKILNQINPEKAEIDYIKRELNNFLIKLKDEITKKKILAEVFVGGSFAKGTIIKKLPYDVDIFIRFDKKYKEKLSDLTEELLNKIYKQEITRIHGSRDYFKVDINPDLFFEIIPVLKVKNSKEADNITDLSFFHVGYIRKKIYSDKILNEIKLAKAFCHANKCYGAESYINGFSGYALELLIYHYKGFLNFAKAITQIKDKEIIDIEKLYKNKYELKININSAKMSSPIVLIDPTYKERNALAALSRETFESFQEACRKLLKNPSEEMFKVKKIDFEKAEKDAQKNNFEFALMEAKTEKQEGDVAGSKLLKFYKHLESEMKKFYDVKNEGFEYEGKHDAKYFFTVKRKKEIIVSGPESKDDKENIKRFKQRHGDVFEKKGKLYAREKITKNIRDFLKDWINANCEKIREMYISELKIKT